MLLRAKYLVDVVGYNRVRGLPLRAAELAEAITDLVEAQTSDDPLPNGSHADGGSPMSQVDLPRPGLRDVPTTEEPLTRKDFTSDQEVRWCPGCGDYAVLAAFQGFLPGARHRAARTW